jgi:hypothetical protein
MKFGAVPPYVTRFPVSPTAVRVILAFVNACEPMVPLAVYVNVLVRVAAFAGNVSRPTKAKHNTVRNFILFSF